jgi:hypothetical protein
VGDGQVRVPNFIVSSSNGKIALVNAAVFELYTKEERRAELLVQGLESEISALCAHPSAPQVTTHILVVAFMYIAESGSNAGDPDWCGRCRFC